MMRIAVMIALFVPICEASTHTRGAQQLGKVQARVFKAKDDLAALAAAPAAAPAAPLPEQGFEGKGVAHKDMDTHTADWGREFGPMGPPMHPAACKNRFGQRNKFNDAICSNAKSTTVLAGIMLIA